MKNSLIAIATGVALSVFVSPAFAAPTVDNYLLQLDDSTGDLMSYGYLNGSLVFNNDCHNNSNCSQADGFYVAGSDTHFNFADNFNVYAPDGVTLVDHGTASAIYDSPDLLQDFVVSAVVGSCCALSPATNYIDTGSFITVASFTVDNVDGTPQENVTIQFRPQAVAVPEPFTLSLFGAGIAGAVAMRRRRQKAKA